MKTVLFFFALAISTLSYAQDSTKVKVETPKIVNKLQYGKSVSVNDIEVKFVELVSDSRCPQGVSCVWAGEVVILVDVLENGKKIDTKKMTFNAVGKANDIYISDGLSISGVNISPYPVYGKKIALEDYKMQLYIKN
ncbi:hypothetical protein [uncultured Lacinutrix sp.]|uniref:hypothetical protein n=1 Tax=uncultured Lacinutrix sp. TaxID=574032 RepID=UPI00262250F9|nr:hypothetical protein [uncultured Lacinutrix sp.]